jgi:F0F1-type ATP synthase membrane subunit b/b'
MNYEQMASKLNEFNSKNIQSLIALTEKSVERSHKLSEINFETTKSILNEVNGTVASVMAAKDPQALMAMTQDGSLDQFAGKLLAHQQAVSKVVREAGEEIANMTEVSVEQIKVSLKDWMDALAANAPAGSDAIVSAMKTSLESTLQGVGQIQAAAKEVATNVEQTTEQAVKAFQGQVATAKKTVATKTTRATARK